MSATDAFYLAAIAAAALSNGVWRLIGLALAARVDESSAVFAWVRMVATALVAALISSLILAPPGALAEVPLWIRLGAVGVGVIVYGLTRRSVAFGILGGEAALIGTLLLLQP